MCQAPVDVHEVLQSLQPRIKTKILFNPAVQICSEMTEIIIIEKTLYTAWFSFIKYLTFNSNDESFACWQIPWYHTTNSLEEHSDCKIEAHKEGSVEK